MKLYNKGDGRLRKWHKNKIRWFQEKTKVSDYGTLWLSFVKGIIIGAILL